MLPPQAQTAQFHFLNDRDVYMETKNPLYRADRLDRFKTFLSDRGDRDDQMETRL